MVVIRMALRSFVIGFIAGVLFAPRSGVETRRLIRERFEALVNQILEIAALPPIRVAPSPNGETAASRARSRRHTEEPSAGATAE